jgi:hypothetical protein
MINFGFDISVKLYSCFLLLLCLIVASPALARIFALLVLHRPVEPYRPRPRLNSERKILGYSIAKGVIIVGISFEALFIYFRTGNFNDDGAPRPFLHGAYAVESFTRGGDAISSTANNGREMPKRIFIHRRGYFITQSPDDRMQDYKLDYDLPNSRLILKGNDGSKTALNYTLSGNEGLLLLNGVMGGDSVVLHARRMDLSGLPLLGSSFHWTTDGYR